MNYEDKSKFQLICLMLKVLATMGYCYVVLALCYSWYFVTFQWHKIWVKDEALKEGEDK